MNLTIRPIEDRDYDEYARVELLTWPFWPADSGDDLRSDDAKLEPKIRWARFLAFDGDQTVGACCYRHRTDSFHPQEFQVDLAVLPEFEGGDVRSRLFEHVRGELEPFQPTALFAWVNERAPQELEFYSRHGFVEISTSFESRLSVQAFDFAPWQHLEHQVRERGYELKTLAELESDPDFKRKFYDLHTALDLDVPMATPYTPRSFEVFCEHHFEDPEFDMNGVIIAVKPGTNGLEYVAMNELWGSGDNPIIRNGLTGVTREHRRQGLALAVKVRGIRYALERGCTQVSTFNAGNNPGMLAVNQLLGFERQPMNLELRKDLTL